MTSLAPLPHLLHCQTCGAPLDAERSQGVCALCLFGEALEHEASETFGGHELCEEIARGGMGVVYRAMQREPRREVALKTLRGAELDSPEAQARFRDEARTMAELEHSGILPIHQFGQRDGVLFFTMKFAAGGTLAERVADYAGQWRRIAELIASVADAVQFAHQHGVLHRDIKPGNILFDEDGHAFVSDFGLAKLAERADGGLTVSAAMLGTPHYMAPEIAAQGLRTATTATDVWSLGVVLHELLAQTRPFKSESVPALMREIAEREPEALSQSVPRDLRVITSKALAKEPARRYASARALADDLRCWLEGRPITARPTPGAERLWLWMKRKPALAAMSMLVLVSVSSAVAALAWGLHRAREETSRANASRDDGQHRLREALIERAHSARLAHRSGWRAQGMKSLREATAIHDGLDVRNEMIAHLVALDIEAGDEIHVPSNAVPSRDFDLFAAVKATTPDGCEVRFFDAKGDQTGANVSFAFSAAATATTMENEHVQASFDSTARRLAVQRDCGGVALIDVAARRILKQWPQTSFGGFSKDGALFALVLDRDHAAVFHSTDGSTAADITGNPKRQIGWSMARLQPADDPTMVLLTQDRTLELWSTDDPRRVSVRVADETLARVAWMGEWVAAAGREMSQVTLWNLRTGRVRSMPTDDSSPASLSFSPDGRLLVAASLRNTSTSVWDTVTGQRVLKSSEVFPRTFSADGTRLAQKVNDRLTLCHVRRSEALQTLDVSSVSQGLSFMDISPDGRWLLLNSRELSESRAIAGCLSIWEIASGRLVCRSNRFSHIVPAAFLADSTHIVGQRVFPHGSTAGTFCIHKLTLSDGVLSLDERQEITPVDLNAMPGLELSPDRRWVAVGGDAGALLFDVADPNALPAAKPMSRAVLDAFVLHGAWALQQKASQPTAAVDDKIAHPWPPPLVSPDGRWFAKVEGDQLRVFATSTPRLAHEHEIAFRSGHRLPLAWSPDSRWLAFASERHNITLLDAARGQVIAVLSGSLDDPVMALRFTPDGRTLVLLRDTGVLEFWNLTTLAAELSDQGLPWDMPPSVLTAAPGVTSAVKESGLKKLYER